MTLSHRTNTGQHTHSARGLDLYQTAPCAIEALLRAEQLPSTIFEPAAGRGAIVNVLRKAGHAVVASDIRDYGFPLDFVADFLATKKMPAGCTAICTNPPYQIATEFARHALDLAPRVYLLCRLAFLESKKRTDILEHRGLARVLIFRARLPMMHRDNWQGNRASNSMAFAWLVWDRRHRGETIMRRIGWS